VTGVQTCALPIYIEWGLLYGLCVVSGDKVSKLNSNRFLL